MKETLTSRQLQQTEAVTVFLANRIELEHEYTGDPNVLTPTSKIARRKPGKFELFIGNMGHYKEIAHTSN